MKNKNIILCADGTGNLGGTTPDSNVYRTYHLIDRYDPNNPQLTYYDNGVGTAANKYWRAFTGAFGFGFKQNVRELYTYLARHYDPGDRVFLFGFSRGAAEVRALTGFIAAAGLINGKNLSRESLETRVEAAFDIYKKGTPNPGFGEFGAIPITFLGVWDTVSALGFPRGWKVRGFGTFLFNLMFVGLDHAFDFIFPHRFYKYKLNSNIQNAYQALAIDETRLSLSPMVWDEHEIDKSTTTVEQVWFAGAHTNVGGGYGRAGLAHVTLAWMLSKAIACGLQLRKDTFCEVAAQANAYGQMYNERDGIGVFYRYFPRDISLLSKHEKGRSKLRTAIKIHESVLDRMRLQIAEYSPGHLPATFEVIKTDEGGSILTEGESKESEKTNLSVPSSAEWTNTQKSLKTWVNCRTWLYALFLDVVLVIVIAAWWYWMSLSESEILPITGNDAWTIPWAMGHLGGVLRYFLPKFFDGLIFMTVEQHPQIFGLAVIVVLVLVRLRNYFRDRYQITCEKIRELVSSAYSGSPTMKK